MVAPSARRRSSITSASLLPSRGAATRCWEAAFVRTYAILRLRLRLLATGVVGYSRLNPRRRRGNGGVFMRQSPTRPISRIAQPETITSIGMRDWAHVGQTL